MDSHEYLKNYSKSFIDLIEDKDFNFLTSNIKSEDLSPNATTVVAVKYGQGIIMAGDRRATQGNYIAHDDVIKVFRIDSTSMIGIAGSAAIAFELVKRFKTEVEHYEKIQNNKLTYNGKVNFLSTLIRSNLNLITQGLIVIPIFAGKSNDSFEINTFDAIGGSYNEKYFASIGSGATMSNVYLQDNYIKPERNDAIKLAIKSLKIASNNDSATVGPSIEKNVSPNIYICDANDVQALPDIEVMNFMKEI